MKKGQIPNTQKLKLESEKAQWLMLNRGLINHLDCTAIVHRLGQTKVRIKLRLIRILKPEDYQRKSNIECGGAPEEIEGGIERMNEFFVDSYRETEWLMFGHILGEDPKPVMIIHYEYLGFSMYTTKLKRDEFEDMLPKGIHLN